MEDVQNHAPFVAMNIDRVGVRGIEVPVRVRDAGKGSQATVARVDLGVDLHSSHRGTHMSRFVEILESLDGILDCRSIRSILESLQTRLAAKKVYAHFSFPFFRDKKSPATKRSNLLGYQCTITAELSGGNTSFLLGMEVPVMTVCPCSKAISDEGAHCQRAIVHMQVRVSDESWFEEFIAMAEESGSSAVYTLLKREDEKYVTEDAFAHPMFVEDVVRNVAYKLKQHKAVQWFSVEVESMESIHNHNAFARIEQ